MRTSLPGPSEQGAGPVSREQVFSFIHTVSSRAYALLMHLELVRKSSEWRDIILEGN